MDLSVYQHKMNVSVDQTGKQVARIRTGRATPALVQDIKIMAYGGAQELRVMELASIHVEDNDTLVIKPWDQSVIGEIAKGINHSGLGLSANIDGEIIRIKIPPLTEERRKEFVKLLKQEIEHGKVAIRQVRHEGMKAISQAETNKEISEDDKHRLEKELQDMTDQAVAQLDELEKAKEAELLAV